MKLDAKLRYATGSDIKRLQQFFERTYTKKHICTQRRHLLWHFHNPFRHQPSKELSALYAEDSDHTILGFLGAVPVKLFSKNTLHNAAWLANWIVLENARGQGVGPRLLKRICKYDITLAASFSIAAYPLYLREGWTLLGKYKRLIRVFNPEKTRKFLQKIHNSRRLSKFQQASFKVSSKPRQGVVHAKTFMEWDRPFGKEQWDRDWPVIRKRFPATVDRSFRYIQWRFLKHPFVTYHTGVLKYKDGTIGGMVIIRKEGTPQFTIGRIVDIVSLPEVDQPLIAGIVQFALGENLDALDFYGTYSGYLKAFKQFGFASTQKYPFSLIPEFFNPVTIRPRDPRKQTILMKAQNSTISPPSRSGDWHIVKADGDRDRAY